MFGFAYISDAQIGHGFMDGEFSHHLTSDNEFLGDTQDWYPQGTILVNPENDMVEAVDAGPLTTFDEYALAMAIHEFNTVTSTIPVGTNPVVVRYGTTKEDSTMSQSQPKTNPNHRPVITHTEQGTQVHVDVDQLAEHSQARLSYRQVFDLARKMAATAVSLQEQAISSIARFHVQNMRNKGRTWIKASSWNAAINDETKIAQVEKKLNTKAQRELAKKARATTTTYKVSWSQLIEAIRNPDNTDPKLKKILSRTTVGRKEIVVNKAQFDQIISLAA